MESKYNKVWSGEVAYIRHLSVPHLSFLYLLGGSGPDEVSVGASRGVAVPDKVKHITTERMGEALDDARSKTQGVLESIAIAVKTCLQVERVPCRWEFTRKNAYIVKHRKHPLQVFYMFGEDGFESAPQITEMKDMSVVRGLNACVRRLLSPAHRLSTEEYTPEQHQLELDRELQSYRPLTEVEAAALGITGTPYTM